MKKTFQKIFLAAALASGFAASAVAAPMTMHVTWSGATMGNSSVGFGTVSFDDSLLPLGSIETENPLFGSIDVTFSNGTARATRYDESRFYFAIFGTLEGLDLSRELIGQAMANGCTYGVYSPDCGPGEFGDFNLSSIDGAPTGDNYFRIYGPEYGFMEVTSLRVERIPESGSLALLALAAGGLIAARRRKSRSK